ncbi:MAG: TonB-dependent receptor plug domain-containing protein, partial [Rikenellaceae bacterium]
ALTANLFAQTQQKQPDKLKPYVGSRLVVTGEQLRRAGEMNIITSLRNIDPSFRVIENSKAGSEPNTLPEIQLRGQTGAQTALPLFILDGVEVPLQRVVDLDPNIVERVVLLKDASDKSRYGIKGGQGVVEIYTNRPSSQRVSVRYNGFMNIQSADLSSYNLCNSREKLVAEMLSGLGRYNGNSQNIVPLDERYINLMKKVDEGLDIDWLSLPLRKSVSQRHNLAVDGTLNRFSYGANFNYDDQQGVMKGSNNRNMQGTLFLDYKWNKLQINNQFNYTDKLGYMSPYGTFD